MDQPKSPSKFKGLTTVSMLTLLSRFTGLGRDALMASLFGTGWILDAFSLAFRLPNTFRRLFGEGAMTAAFLPEFVRLEQSSGREESNQLFSAVGWRLMGILARFVVVTELVVAAVYFGMRLSDRSALLCELTMILLPFMLLICMSGFYAAALNGVHHFTAPSLAPILLNVCWLIGGLIAATVLATGTAEVRMIAVAIVVGGCFQLVLLAWQASRFRVRLLAGSSERFVLKARQVFRSMTPVLIGLSITQINAIVDSLLAWGLSSGNMDQFPELERFRLPEGTTGALYLGQRLFQFPMGVFAVALGTILFPRFARDIQENNSAGLNRDVVHGLQLVAVVGAPASAGLWLMSTPITVLLFRHGQFDDIATKMTSDMISAYGLGVIVFSALLIVNRVFYAANDQLTPMRQGMLCVGLNIMFDIVLLPIFAATALPLASILATCFQLGLALEVLGKRFLTAAWRSFVPLLLRIAFGTGVMTLVVRLIQKWLPAQPFASSGLPGQLISVLLPIVAAILVYATVLTLLGVSLRTLTKEPVPSAGTELSGD